MTDESFRCYLVTKTGKDQISSGVETRPLVELPAGDVLVKVAYSSVNYKDAMAATGHPGVVRKFPHVPGIDAAGTVADAGGSDLQVGDEVIVTSYGLGADRWGAWAEFIRVPAEWVVPLPNGLSLHEAMVYGTAGFTAALGLTRLHDNGVAPDTGEIVVTGATGGVGSMAVQLLAHLGYQVVAVTGKTDRQTWLAELGATRVIPRHDLLDDSSRPLLSTRWAGGIDTVGGGLLTSVLKSTQPGGCVAMCGLVGGAELPMTVYPFILRGITLSGIDSAWCPHPLRCELWQKLAREWKPGQLTATATAGLSELDSYVRKMLDGDLTGRIVVEPAR